MGKAVFPRAYRPVPVAVEARARLHVLANFALDRFPRFLPGQHPVSVAVDGRQKFHVARLRGFAAASSPAAASAAVAAALRKLPRGEPVFRKGDFAVGKVLALAEEGAGFLSAQHTVPVGVESIEYPLGVAASPAPLHGGGLAITYGLERPHERREFDGAVSVFVEQVETLDELLMQLVGDPRCLAPARKTRRRAQKRAKQYLFRNQPGGMQAFRSIEHGIFLSWLVRGHL